MNTKLEELKILNEQRLATTLFIISLFISLSINFDTRQKLQGKKRIYTNKSSKNIAIFNRTFIIFIVLIYLQIDNENIELSKQKHKQNNLLQLQKIIEIITLGTAITALYISIKTPTDNNTSSIENPTI